jgi:hypothetical protein
VFEGLILIEVASNGLWKTNVWTESLSLFPKYSLPFSTEYQFMPSYVYSTLYLVTQL